MVHINYHPDKARARPARSRVQRRCVCDTRASAVGAHEGCHSPLGRRRHQGAGRISGTCHAFLFRLACSTCALPRPVCSRRWPRFRMVLSDGSRRVDARGCSQALQCNRNLHNGCIRWLAHALRLSTPCVLRLAGDCLRGRARHPACPTRSPDSRAPPSPPVARAAPRSTRSALGGSAQAAAPRRTSACVPPVSALRAAKMGLWDYFLDWLRRCA